MHVTDALSRLFSDESMPIPDLNAQVHAVRPQFSNEYLRKIQEQTPKDPEVATLKELAPVLPPYWIY